MVYDKCADFDFRIVNFPSVCSKMQELSAYDIYYISQQIRSYDRACSSYGDFIDRGRTTHEQACRANWKIEFRKFYDRYQERMWLIPLCSCVAYIYISDFTTLDIKSVCEAAVVQFYYSIPKPIPECLCYLLWQLFPILLCLMDLMISDLRNYVWLFPSLHFLSVCLGVLRVVNKGVTLDKDR